MQAVNALQRLGTAKLLEANQKATELLLKGTVVDGVEGWDQGRGRTVHFIDWDNPDNNRFRAINQFQVACPAGQADKHIRPDIVLFVNGIPLVVVECKSPYAATPLEDAVNQLQRYANRRRDLGVVDVNEGNEQLFHYSQFVVATCGEQARAGTFSSLAVRFLEWKDTSPTPMAEVADELGKAGAALPHQPREAGGGNAAARAPARHLAPLHPVHGVGRAQGEAGLPLPAVPCRAVGHPADAHRQDPIRGRRAGPPRRHHLAHPGEREEPHHGLPDPQDALGPEAAPLQDRCRHRPAGPAEAARRHRRPDRRGADHRQTGTAGPQNGVVLRGPAGDAAAQGQGSGLRHDPEVPRRAARCGRARRRERG